MDNVFDVIIIGGGPAGLSAGLYASRARMKTLLIEKAATGGQINTTEEIENYPGVGRTNAKALMEKMTKQAIHFGTKFVKDNIKKIINNGYTKQVLGENDNYLSKTVIIATGAEPRMLGVKGERELRGRGVSYCATCDADFFTDLNVMVVGGGDTAIEEAIYLTKFAYSVTVVHRRDQLRATKAIQERAFANKKIKFIWNSVIEEIKGDELVEYVVVKNVKTNEIKNVKVDGIFIFVGQNPNTEFLKGFVELNKRGYIITNEMMETSIEGVFAAGDVRDKFLRQVVTAVNDGAIAAVAAEKYINEMKSSLDSQKAI